MAFDTLTAAQIQVGEPIAQEILQKIKDNEDDHENRISDNETAVNTFLPIIFSIYGAYSPHIPIDGILHYRLNFAISILSARLLVIDDGASGTLECDIEYKRGAGAWTSIFATLPSIASGGGDNVLSTNQVLSADVIANGLQEGDILRLNIDTGQVGNYEFHAIIELETN